MASPSTGPSSAVCYRPRIPTAFGIIDELTAEHGLVTCENVPIIAPDTHE